MALAFAGAKGETADQIVDVMKFISHASVKVASSFRCVLDKYKNSNLFKIANKLYVQEGEILKLNYQTMLKDDYRAETDTVNFADKKNTLKTINSWVSTKTADRIPNLISSKDFNENVRLVLLNALYFNGTWEYTFDSEDTAESDFWLSETKAIRVPFMNKRTYFGLGCFQDLDCTALEMPYRNIDLSMLILLPNKRNGLQNLLKNLKSINLVDLAKNITDTKVKVSLPKFKMEYTMDLSDVLKQLGLTHIFESTADFSNMLDSTEQIFVSKALHKACIEVNEVGTEASAATGGVILSKGLPEAFNADHPFMFLIWDKANILFTGLFVNSE